MNVVVWGQVKSENSSLPLAVRASETRVFRGVLKLLQGQCVVMFASSVNILTYWRDSDITVWTKRLKEKHLSFPCLCVIFNITDTIDLWTTPMQVERENPETTKHLSIINTIQNKRVFVCLFVYAVLFSMRIVDTCMSLVLVTRQQGHTKQQETQ